MTTDETGFQQFHEISAEAMAAFDQVSSQVEEAVTGQCLAKDHPHDTMGPEAESLIRAGLGMVTKMLRAAMSFSSEGILRDELNWGKTRLPESGVSVQMVQRNFDRYSDALEEALTPDEYGELRSYLDFMKAMQRQIVEGAPSSS